jgi:DNA primase
MSDILEIIGQHVQLEHQGKKYVGLCPFHQEKTPSFTVDPSAQTFCCLGCGAKGMQESLQS